MDKKEKKRRKNIETRTLTEEEWISALYPKPKPKTEKEKRVLIPRKDRKNPCVAEYEDEKAVKTDKFENIGIDEDTTILFQTPAHFGEYDVLYQKWSFTGLIAESLIFVTDDIKNITMDELKNEIRNSPMVKDSSKEITISSGKSEFTFFNFNFVAD